MNRLPSIVRQHIAALRLLLVFTVLTGIIYPVVMWGVAQVAFHNQANGSLVSYHGRVVGSSLLCQEFVDAKGNPLPQYFQPRPSDAILSGGQERLRLQPAVLQRVEPRPEQPGADPVRSSSGRRQIAAFDHVKISQIPADAVTASGSGLDPDISPANAAIQVDRVAAARHVSPAAVMALVSQYTQGRTLGLPRRAAGERAQPEHRARPEVPAAVGTGQSGRQVTQAARRQAWTRRAGGRVARPRAAHAAAARGC